jgi:acyl carrier protein
MEGTRDVVDPKHRRTRIGRQRQEDLAGRAKPVWPPMMNEIDDTVREVLEAHGRLSLAASSLKVGDDLYQRGLSSHASVNVMLALEDVFDVEFPDSLLRRDTFRSIESIREALESLGVAVAPG